MGCALILRSGEAPGDHPEPDSAEPTLQLVEAPFDRVEEPVVERGLDQLQRWLG